jgi:NAD(P)H dehydrogenase (quinone)
MTVIVSGASGLFGRVAAERLLDILPGKDVILTSRTPERLDDLAARGAQVRFADFDRPETLRDAFQGGERMLLISTARVGTRVGQHSNAIDAAKAVGVRQIAYTSVIAADQDGNPAIVKKDHRATEILMEESGVAWTHLRDSQYAEAVAENVVLAAFFSGKQVNNNAGGRVGLVARGDCVDCAVAVLTTPGHENTAYTLTGPEAFTFEEAMDMVFEMTGKRIPTEQVDSAAMQAYFDAMGVPRHASDIVPEGPFRWSSDDMITFGEAIAKGFFAPVTDHVERITGRPATPFREVMERARGMWPV